MPEKARSASAFWPGFTTRKVFDGLGKYPYVGPCCTRSIQKRCSASSRPPAAASSANYTCVAALQFEVAVLRHLSIRGITLSAYKAMESGQPWVVPSSEDSSIPPVTNKRDGER